MRDAEGGQSHASGHALIERSKHTLLPMSLPGFRQGMKEIQLAGIFCYYLTLIEDSISSLSITTLLSQPQTNEFLDIAD
jgi:hypothetical protein